MNIQGKVALVTGGVVRVDKAITLMRARRRPPDQGQATERGRRQAQC